MIKKIIKNWTRTKTARSFYKGLVNPTAFYKWRNQEGIVLRDSTILKLYKNDRITLDEAIELAKDRYRKTAIFMDYEIFVYNLKRLKKN